MVIIKENDIELSRGDTLFLRIDLSGRALPAGTFAVFTVKKDVRSPEWLIQKCADASAGAVSIQLGPSETDLEPGLYYWDLRLQIPLESGGYEVVTPMDYAAFVVLNVVGDLSRLEEEPGIQQEITMLQDVFNRLSIAVGEANAAAARAEKAAEGPAADAALLAGKAPEYYIQPRNLLDNSDFGNPVAQAGHNGFHGNNLYPIDRWLSWSSEIEVGDGYIKPNTPIDQNLNPADIDTNKVYTLAIKLLDGTVVCNTGTFAASFGTYATCFAGTDNGRIFVRIGENQKVVWTALYEGEYTADTLPPYVPKGYAAELAECQRYAYVIGEGNWLTGFHVIGHGLVVPLELPALRAHNTPSAECAAQAYIGTDGWVDITFRHLGYDYVTGVVHNIIFEPPAELQSGEVCIVSGIKGLFSDL